DFPRLIQIHSVAYHHVSFRSAGRRSRSSTSGHGGRSSEKGHDGRASTVLARRADATARYPAFAFVDRIGFHRRIYWRASAERRYLSALVNHFESPPALF